MARSWSVGGERWWLPAGRWGPAAALTVHDESLRRSYTECDRWRAAVIDLVRDLEPDLVVVANTSHYLAEGAAGPPTDEAWAQGFEATLSTLSDAAPTVLLGDTPYPKEWMPGCLAEHLASVTSCVLERDDLKDVASAALERRGAEAAGVPYAPTTDLLCGRLRCPVIVDNVLVYRDDSHLTATYARHLAPRLADVLEVAVPENNPVVDAPD